MGDRDLMSMHADILFRYDGSGRMVCSNDPEERPAPRLFLGSTTDGQLVRLGQAVPETVARRLAEILEHHPAAGVRPVPPAVLAALRAALEGHAPITQGGGGPAYRFPEQIARPSEATRVTDANRALVRETYPWLYDELAFRQPCCAPVRDGACRGGTTGTWRQ